MVSRLTTQAHRTQVPLPMIAAHSKTHFPLAAAAHVAHTGPRQTALPTLPGSFARAHLVGICGAGMKGLAELLSGLGWQVTGSDLSPVAPVFQTMQARGIRVHTGHQDHHLPAETDVLVYSPAVDVNNPERRMAARLGIPQMSYSQMLGHLMRDRVGVAIAGTHGKSTTTALAACILGGSHVGASAVVGAQLRGIGCNGWAGTGDVLVVESCEYQRSFLDTVPRYATILGIEPDHFDCYGTFDETIEAFGAFARRVDAGGKLLIRHGCAVSQQAARQAQAEVITLSRTLEGDWFADSPRPAETGMRFRIFFRGEFFLEAVVGLVGEHNVFNVLAAVALSHYAGATTEEIRDGLAEFPGIGRRFEKLGWWRGIALVDDYAHHPTEVKATLETARAQFSGRKIWCAFQPHQVSRTLALMDEFAASFSAADEVLVAPVFAARETLDDEPVAAARELCRRIAARGVSAHFCDSLDRIRATIDDSARAGDVFLTLGAGDIYRVHHELSGRIQRDHATQ